MDATDPLFRVTAYRLAGEFVDDIRPLALHLGQNATMGEVAGQLLRAAGSIAANIAEGYSRGSGRDRRRFYEYALGSAHECDAWLTTAGIALSSGQRTRLTSIRRLLLTMIRNAREDASRVQRTRQ